MNTNNTNNQPAPVAVAPATPVDLLTSDHRSKNLLTETLVAIAASGHTCGQIVFIGSERTGRCCTWARFCELADYDYGQRKRHIAGAAVVEDLVIVFADGRKLCRDNDEEYGFERWYFERPFVMPTETSDLDTLFKLDSPAAVLHDGLSRLRHISDKHIAELALTVSSRYYGENSSRRSDRLDCLPPKEIERLQEHLQMAMQ